MRYSVTVREDMIKEFIVEASSIEEARVIGLAEAKNQPAVNLGAINIFAFRLADK